MARYDSYILRVWRSTDPQHTQWSCRIEHLQGGELLQFGTPEALLTHLGRLLGEMGTQDTADPLAIDDPARMGRLRRRATTPPPDSTTGCSGILHTKRNEE